MTAKELIKWLESQTEGDEEIVIASNDHQYHYCLPQRYKLNPQPDEEHPYGEPEHHSEARSDAKFCIIFL